MSNETSWLGKFDAERRNYLQRALNDSNVGTILVQQDIRKVVEMLTLRELGAQSVLTRRQGSGDGAHINRRAAGTTGAEWVLDTDSATEETGSYTRADFTFKTLLTRARVTRFQQAQGASYGDTLGTELVGKAEDFAAALESALIIGDTNANSKQIDGLLTLVGNVSGQVVAQTTATAGDVLTVDKLDETIDKVRGAGNRSDLVILGSFKGLRQLNAALQAQQRFTEFGEVGAGFRVRTYDGIPMVTSTAIPDTLTWGGSSITAFSGGSTTALIVVNKRYNYIEELTRLSVMPLARSTSQYSEVDIFWDGVLVHANTLGASILGGIAG